MWYVLGMGVAISIISLIPVIDRQIELFVLGKYSPSYLVFLSALTLLIAIAVTFRANTKGG